MVTYDTTKLTWTKPARPKTPPASFVYTLFVCYNLSMFRRMETRSLEETKKESQTQAKKPQTNPTSQTHFALDLLTVCLEDTMKRGYFSLVI